MAILSRTLVNIILSGGLTIFFITPPSIPPKRGGIEGGVMLEAKLVNVVILIDKSSDV
jgi:hypothetical protein